MYDPVIGRVLSPHAYVQAPVYTQSYNRYSNCMTLMDFAKSSTIKKNLVSKLFKKK